ncbi:MAG: HDIG domain-containing protein [Clostridia bacterium]|nr:HDIG domain-containing protein [Clostridia bacterium]
MMRPKWSEKGKSKSGGIRHLMTWFRGVEARCMLIVLVGTLVLFAIFAAACAPQRYNLKVGAISHQTITATKDVVDQLTTEEKRKAAANAVEPTYHLKEGATEQVMGDLNRLFTQLRTVQQYGLTLREEGQTAESLRYHTFEDSAIEYAQNLVTDLELSRYQAMTLLRTDTEDYDEMVSAVTTAVSNALNTTIREGQVNQSIQTILQIVGYKVEISLFQNIVQSVLRSCVQPNMVIEQEATEAAREKAMAAVEPVMFLQGQNIIREGERVTSNQLAMLRELGLLEDNNYDLSIYGGAALLVVTSVLLMTFLLAMLTPEILHDIRRMSVIMLVMVINEGLAVLMVKLFHIYLAPITLGAMLLTGLIGPQAGIAASASLSLLISGLVAGSNTSFTAEMIHLLMTGLVGGVISVRFLKGKPQRLRIVVCGLLAALSNVMIMLAVDLMTSSDAQGMLTNVIWSIGGGILSGVLAAGLQPVFETAFNLATPSKLLELANPNQPLLRRLLLEAPGTYHHAIVVANLSEAAAESIGANPLLARTGAYFHDIGKLKRPLYFKENQMGENPHDRTDPYVSAAILTTHTRDGLQLAQKYRLPPEIQRIIVEHHGDTPVMYFYHKALQMADGKPVDISDFRYDGTRPTTKESAIVMLADTIEAAVRSMPDPTPQAIEKFIERLVRGKLEDGQLSNSPLTLRDIDGICEAFCTVLNGVFHERIEYPSVNVPGHNTVLPPKPEEAPAQPEEKAAEKAGVEEKTVQEAEVATQDDVQERTEEVSASAEVQSLASDEASSTADITPKEEEA